MPPNEFSKNPIETYPIGMDYTGKAPNGAILVSAQWSAVDIDDNTDATSSVLASTTAVVDGMVAKGRVESGLLGHVYRLSVRANFNTGDVLHDTIYMFLSIDG